MIDYDKLKLAHELATIYSKKESSSLVLEINFYIGGCHDDGHNLYFGNSRHNSLENVSLEKIIDTLKELTQSKPKYEDGQEVWLMYTPIYTNTMQPGKFKTDAHKYEDGVHQYCLIGNGVALTWREENTIYPSREALIDAQIKYWTCLKNEETSICSDDVSMECEHEWESELEPLPTASTNPRLHVANNMIKCKKCGEFYR